MVRKEWMAEEYAEELDGLNSYTYSLDSAVKELEDGGWVYNEDGSDYSGSGIRYKKLDDGTYMPLVIEWFSSENNSVSDLLVTSLQQNPDVEAKRYEDQPDRWYFHRLTDILL